MFASAALASFASGLPASSRAAAWAADAHAGQTRAADGAPFVMHPFEVALLVHGAGYRDEVVAAGLLHDVVEKAAVAIETVRDAFGPVVAAMVATLSEDPSIPDFERRRQALRDSAAAATDEVLAVFAADKIVKARELRLAVAADRMPRAEVAATRAHGVASLAILERRLPDHPFTEALRFELAAQVAMPALAWLRPAPLAVAAVS